MSETNSVPAPSETTATGGVATEPLSAPETGAPAPAADTAAPPDAPAGPPRGPDGKFVSAATTTPEPSVGDAPASAPDPSAPAVPKPEAAPNAPPASAPSGAQPFTFRASGQRIPIEGALYEPGKGLVIPDAKVPDIRRLLAHGHEYATQGIQRERELKQQISALQAQSAAQKEAEDAELKVYKDWFLELVQDQSGARLLKAVENFAGESALLSERAARAKLEKQIAAQQAAKPAQPEQTPEAQSAALAQSIVRVATDFTEELRESGAYGALTDADWKYLAGLASQNPRWFLGEQDGEVVFDGQLMLEWAKQRQDARTEAAKQSREVAKATEYNAKRAQPAAAAPPPAAKAPPAPAKREEDESILAKHYRKADEARNWNKAVTGFG